MLRAPSHGGIDRSLALALTGFILFVLANSFPFLTLDAQGQRLDSTLVSSSLSLYAWDQPILGTLVLLTTFVFPLAELLGVIYLLLPLRLGRRPARHSAGLARFLQSTQPWGMLEIFMLAVLVAVVKLGDIAHVIPGLSLYAFAALIGTMALLSTTLDLFDYWEQLPWEQPS